MIVRANVNDNTAVSKIKGTSPNVSANLPLEKHNNVDSKLVVEAVTRRNNGCVLTVENLRKKFKLRESQFRLGMSRGKGRN